MSLPSNSLPKISLDDKYTVERGRVLLTGTQALVRLPLMQRRRDLAAGRNTAGFISGYRGSPLGAYDQQLWRASGLLEEHHIRFQPGVNEDLAATAIWGSQQVGLYGDAKYDGVFSIWYGKGPGVDRSGDAFKHANQAGTARWGGVLALAGDDHMAKSSTVAHQSEFAFVDALIPVINPAGVQEFLDLGLHGWAMSRFAGVWVGFKCVGETVDSSATVHVDPERISIIEPDYEMPPGGLNGRLIVAEFLAIEELLHRHKIPAALAYARANRLDRVAIGGPRRRIGIATAGKSYLDVRQALDDLGLDERTLQEIGVSLYKVAMTWPLEPEGLRAFAEGLDLLLVVEEKRSLIEWQSRDLLYGLPADRRPTVIGKVDERGAPLFPSNGELTPGLIAQVIADRLGVLDLPESLRNGMRQRMEQREAIARHAGGNAPPTIARTPYFCSGCPHNSSTKVPEGSRAGAGIGCHYMVQWMDRSTAGFTHMGAEGANWTGQAPFVKTPHIFQNLGDGTYFHSGLLAIRAAVASGVNITYKILFNDAVAMTGGQQFDGPLTVPMIVNQIAAEGVRQIIVVSDEPEKYPDNVGFPPSVRIEHRDGLDRVQRELREVPGTTAIVYDQTCAAEKRRRRKRGDFPDPDKRIFINDLVCEGCGDCGVKSNCVSVQPIETEFGRKREIDQSSCNKDFSCVKGFCPSFVTVHGAKPRKRKPTPMDSAQASGPQMVLPLPELPSLQEPYGIVITGIGGTGVITIGAVLAMAAHIDGKASTAMDMTGLAQKNGAVWSHLRLAERPEDLHAVRIAAGGAALLIGCDLVVSSHPDTVTKLARGSSRAVVNTHRVFTGDFSRNPDMRFPTDELLGRISATIGEDAVDFLDATTIATALMGDSIATNLFMMGYAFQKGLIPISLESILTAIELNGVSVESSKRSFEWGCRAAADPAAVQRATAPATPPEAAVAETLDEIVARRVAFLTDYQNAGYAKRYEDLVRKVEQVEREKAKGFTGLAMAVARYYFKLLAYKDEYEVARLYAGADGHFRKNLERQFEGDYRLEFNLAPPLLARIDKETGQPKKMQFGPWMMSAFGMLARLKFLRGTALDPFGRTEERRTERRLIEDYERTIGELLAGLNPDTHRLAVEIASIPEAIRGFGHVKAAHLEKAKAREAELLERFRAPVPAMVAAE
jgi:indolepyruvate ferredoxin oxidoreductase